MEVNGKEKGDVLSLFISHEVRREKSHSYPFKPNGKRGYVGTLSFGG